MIIAEVFKFLGVILSAAVAVYATRTDHMKTSDSTGALTRKGWRVITLALIGVLISGGAQLFQIFDVIESSRKNQERQEQLTDRLENISYQAVRQYYPLEPVALVYVLEYPMDQPFLSEYADVVGKKIYDYLVEQRQGRGATDPSLKNEDVIFRLSSNEDWLPSTREARFNLLEDSTSFTFTMPTDDRELRFHSARKGEEEIFVSLPLKGTPQQEITLFADFDRRVFLKEVTSQNPLRTGDDLAAVSALDLVGRRMDWASGASIMPEEANSNWYLKKFGFIFPFDYAERSTSRQINSTRAWGIPDGDMSYIIGPGDVGLADVYEELGLSGLSDKQSERN
ncbi:hypothetical protein [Pelagibius sp.]|uniref:hypothetical protein n=1 Tax=Pelagibius sp. TaxID=1931238 RepID=UPI003B504BB2